MQTNTLLKKGLAIALIVLLGTSIIPIVGSLSTNSHTSTNDSNAIMISELIAANPDGINVTISGTMGLNGWYVSGVVITITGEGVNHTYYSFDNQTWDEYMAPITINTDGIYALYVYCMDPDGEYHYYGPFPFKIDKTPPTLNVTVYTNFWKTRWGFKVNVSDNMSGVGSLEFYIDGTLVGNITPSGPGPYDFIWAGKGRTAQVIAYDNAGNSANSSIITPCIQQQSSPIVQQKTLLFQHLISNLILCHQMTVKQFMD
jgi:hypothetical protein